MVLITNCANLPDYKNILQRILLKENGEKITFKITSETEFHTFTIDELDLYETADAGESYEFTITFETAGTYRLYCVPHETLGMIGEVIVQ